MPKYRTRSIHSQALLGLTVLTIAGWLVLPAAARTQRLESHWCTQAPVVDGRDDEWQNPLERLGASALSVGLQNDNEFLYIVVTASEAGTRMLLSRAGFTIWWDPAGKEQKAFGIGIPAVVKGESPSRPPGGGERSSSQAGPPSQPPGAGTPPIEILTNIEAIGPGRDQKRPIDLPFAATLGLGAANAFMEGTMIYELKIPIAATDARPYAIRGAVGGMFGLGIETGEIPADARGPRGGGGTGGFGGRGGTGGFGGAGGRQGGGRFGGGEFSPMKPIKIWTVVHLSAPPQG